MSEAKITGFKLKTICFPHLLIRLTDYAADNWEISYLVEPTVLSDKVLRLNFGVQLLSRKESDNENNESMDAENFHGIVSAVVDAEFEVLNGSFPVGIKAASEIPLMGNMLATLYPYLREKVYSLLYANKIEYHLPSMNMIRYVTDFGPKFQVRDLREN